MNVNTDTLESMCGLIIDCPHSTPKWTEEGVIVLRNQNIKNGVLSLSSIKYTNEDGYQKRIKRAVPQAGDIVFTREAPMGEVCMIPVGLKCCLGQRQVLLRPKNDICGKYLFWALLSPSVQRQISWNEGTGSTVSNVRIPVLKALNIPRHPNKEVHIAKVLSDLASKIELNRQTNQTLEHIAQAIFKSWFVDFEPTRAKITAEQNNKDPERAAMAAISGKSLKELDQLSSEQQEQLKTTAALFPNAFVDSELGEIPKGWDASTLGEHFNLVMGQSPKGDTYNEEGNGTLFFQGRRDFGFRYPTPRVYTTAPKRLAQAGDVLVSVRAPVGDRNMANQECCLGRGVAGIRHKTGARSFTYAFIGHIEKNLSNSGSDGTVFSSINKNELGAVGFVSPSNNLLNLYELKIDFIDQHIEVHSLEIETLENIRDSILPKLLSGETSFELAKPIKRQYYE